MMLERSSPKEMNPTLSKLLIKPVLATAYGGIVGAFLGGTVGMVVMGLAGRNPQLLARSGASLFRSLQSPICHCLVLWSLVIPVLQASGRKLGSMYLLLKLLEFGQFWSQLHLAMAGAGTPNRLRLSAFLVSGSGAGLTFCFLSKGLKARPEQALFSAAGFAVMSATAYKMMQTTKPRNAQDAFYIETKAMLSKLGLEEYEKNFKKGHLTDFTLPLLTDSDLKDVNIPSGARRLILDHIKRFVHKLLYSHMDQMYELDPTMHSLLS
ncbi:hypothetical protein YC2023_085289 [Brassica napus]|uniref:SAM domain-containing protein n=2 Tax=Brassica TaxID=3705 RepID=A0A3P6ELH9_BRAOL|nr:unnamed protein product [Brassica oleracea]